MKFKNITNAALAALLASASAQAAVITGVTIEDFSSERGGFSRFVVSTIDGSGLDEEAGTHDTGNTGWQTNNDSAPFITFDLGAIYSIESMHVWNYNGADNSDVENLTFNYGETSSLGSTLGNITLTASSGGNSYTGETITFDDPITARYIQFDITSGYGGFEDGVNSERVGLAEVRFAAVPEPSAALLGGFGMLALLRRRR